MKRYFFVAFISNNGSMNGDTMLCFTELDDYLMLNKSIRIIIEKQFNVTNVALTCINEIEVKEEDE